MTALARTLWILLGLGALFAVGALALFLTVFGPVLGASLFAPQLPGILFGKGGSMKPATFEGAGLPIVDHLGGETTLRAIVRGGIAFTATGPELVALDLSDPAAPKRVGSLLLGGDVRDLLPRGTHLYVANGTHGLRVIDASDPRRLREVAGMHTGAAADRVLAVGERLVVWSEFADLMEVSTDDPAAPRIVSTMTRTSGLPSTRTGTDHVAAGASGLFVFNALTGGEYDEAIRLPAWGATQAAERILPPARIAPESPDFRYAQGALWDWRDPARPFKLGDAPGFDGVVRQVELAGGRVYASGRQAAPRERDGIVIYDASRAGILREIGFVPKWAKTFTVDGERLHLVTRHCALETWDVSRPASPRRLGGWCAPTDAALLSLEAGGDALWAGGQGGLLQLRPDAAGAFAVTERFDHQPLESAAFTADGAWTVRHYALRRLRSPAAPGGAWRVDDWPLPASHSPRDQQFDGDLVAIDVAYQQAGTPTENARHRPAGFRRLDVYALPGSAAATGRTGSAEGSVGLRRWLEPRDGRAWSTIHPLGPPRLASIDDAFFVWALRDGMLWDARVDGERRFLRARDASRPTPAPLAEIELPATQEPRAFAFGERHLYVRTEIGSEERGRRSDGGMRTGKPDERPTDFLLVYAIERDPSGALVALRLVKEEALTKEERSFARDAMTVHDGLLGWQAGMSTYVLRDLTDPANPRPWARLELDRWNDIVTTFRRSGERIVVGTEKSGIFVFDARGGRGRSR